MISTLAVEETYKEQRRWKYPALLCSIRTLACCLDKNDFGICKGVNFENIYLRECSPIAFTNFSAFNLNRAFGNHKVGKSFRAKRVVSYLIFPQCCSKHTCIGVNGKGVTVILET